MYKTTTEWISVTSGNFLWKKKKGRVGERGERYPRSLLDLRSIVDDNDNHDDKNDDDDDDNSNKKT